MRRFQVSVSSSLHVDTTSLLCLSENMFVHNNSKHGRKIRRLDGTDGLYPVTTLVPQIKAISPSEGWTMGGQTIVIIGDNFKPGLQVIFGGVPLQCQVISSHALRVQSPPALEGVVEVTLALETQQYNISCPGTFTYISTTQPGLDQGFTRLAKLVPRMAGDPSRLARDVVLHRAADMIQARQVGRTLLPLDTGLEVKESKPKIEELLLAPWITDLDCDY